MKILVTGAFGNIGFNVVEELLQSNHQVRCFDVQNAANQKKADKVEDKVEIIWGDLRKAETLPPVVQGMDAVIHLAGIIPPGSEKNTKLAWDINVNGTKYLIEAMQAQPKPPKLVFSSSISVFGHTQHLSWPRKVTDPLNPPDNYARSKVECEKMIQASGLQWVILRLAAAAPVMVTGFGGSFDPSVMFEIPLNTRMEFVHPRDVAHSLANAAIIPEAEGKIFLIGGGPGCQMHFGDFLSRILDVFGIGPLPKNAFTPNGAFYTDWLDTAESQKVLQYQRTSFEEYAQEMALLWGSRRYFVEMVRAIAKLWLVNKSPYIKVKN